MVAPPPPPPNVVVATRLHLGNAASPPSHEALQDTIRQLVDFCRSSSSSSCGSSRWILRQAVIAVDATPKFPHYDLVDAVQKACDQVLLLTTTSSSTLTSSEETSSSITNFSDWLFVLPVTPWGMFVPALNALVGHAMSATIQADFILFVSAESCSSSHQVLSTLWQHMEPETTLVCGAVLSGHDYHHQARMSESTTQDTTHGIDSNDDTTLGVQRELTGRTTPWNTMALWNLSKLGLTGFLLLSDGLVDPQAYGVEEVLAIATLQTLLGPEQAVAKLIAVPGVTWDQEFGADEQRQQWHEQKMASKYTRAQRQLDRLKLKGWVYHY